MIFTMLLDIVDNHQKIVMIMMNLLMRLIQMMTIMTLMMKYKIKRKIVFTMKFFGTARYR